MYAAGRSPRLIDGVISSGGTIFPGSYTFNLMRPSVALSIVLAKYAMGSPSAGQPVLNVDCTFQRILSSAALACCNGSVAIKPTATLSAATLRPWLDLLFSNTLLFLFMSFPVLIINKLGVL